MICDKNHICVDTTEIFSTTEIKNRVIVIIRLDIKISKRGKSDSYI